MKNQFYFFESPTFNSKQSPISLLGKPVKSGYQSNYVLTNKDGEILPNPEKTGQTGFDEIVISQESQVVPIYIL